MARNQPTHPRLQPTQRLIGGLAPAQPNARLNPVRPSSQYAAAKPVPVLYPGNAATFQRLSNDALIDTLAANPTMLKKWGKDEAFIARMEESAFNAFSYKGHKLINLDWVTFRGPSRNEWADTPGPGAGFLAISKMLKKSTFTDAKFRSALKSFNAPGDLDLLRGALIQALSPSEVTELQTAIAQPLNSFSLPAGVPVKP